MGAIAGDAGRATRAGNRARGTRTRGGGTDATMIEIGARSIVGGTVTITGEGEDHLDRRRSYDSRGGADVGSWRSERNGYGFRDRDDGFPREDASARIERRHGDVERNRNR